MERQLKWKKIGGGTFRLARGKIIKPNQIFSASKDEIPNAFKDSVILLDKNIQIDDAKIIKEESNDVEKYKLHSKGGGWYDILNATGKVINEKNLRKDDAEALLKNLEEVD